MRFVLAILPLAIASSLAASSTPLQDIPAERAFEFAVREDFFAGFKGDYARFEKALTLCRDTLARHPDHAEATVWLGSGTHIRGMWWTGEPHRAQELMSEGLALMDKAVSLAPRRVGVRIPRASTLLGSARFVGRRNPAMARRYFATAAADYELVRELQASDWGTRSEHARGELLGGLAEAWHGLDEEEKVRLYLARLATELPGTRYAARAIQPARAGEPLGVTCLGCHVSRDH